MVWEHDLPRALSLSDYTFGTVCFIELTPNTTVEHHLRLRENGVLRGDDDLWGRTRGTAMTQDS